MSSAIATAPTLLPSRRQHLSPMKPNAMKSTRNSNRMADTNSSPTATKRSLSQNDENGDVLSVLSNTAKSSRKRVKSALSGSLTAALKSAISSASGSNLASPKPKRAFGTLVDVTNTRASDSRDPFATKAPSKSLEKPSLKSAKSTKPARTVLSPKKASPIAHKPPSPRRSAGYARTRARTPPSPRRPAFRRIDPPTFSTSHASIDSLLASVRPLKLQLFSDAAPQAAEPTLPLVAASIPDSWAFEIYEDSPEETLQNLMEHSTCTLDISDDSDDESVASELQEKGKENIAPARLAELLAVAPVERANVMHVDDEEKAIPQRRAARREALREMRKEELEKLPTLKEEFPVFTPKKRVAPPLGDVTPKSPESPGFVVWESDHEEEETKEEGEEGEGVKALDEVDDELERELESGFEIWGGDADSLGGSSDGES